MTTEEILTTNNQIDLRELTFRFVALEKSARMLMSSLDLNRLEKSELEKELVALKKENIEQAEQLKKQRQQLRELDTKIKQLEKNQNSLNEKLKNFKEFAIIVKNPKNADTVVQLKEKLNDYIRYIEDTIALLKTI